MDSGINKDHEDLEGLVVKEYNAISPNEPVIDDFGHGTAIAGIIGAQNNEVGIIGVSPNVQIYSVKVLDERGKGNIEALIRGVEWAIENKVNVINVSFGIGVCQYSCRIKLLNFSIKIKICSIQIPSSNVAIALRLMAC